jgi:glucose-6-phosphate 1-dehydrogenase
LPDQPEPYEPGSWGPQGAELMLAREGFSWRRP